MSTDDEALNALTALVSEGGWRPIPGPPSAHVVIRPWPDGSVDSLAFRAAGAALAERTNPAGHPVWRRTGPLTEVISELRALPAPDAPDAPQRPIGGGADRAGWPQ